MPPEWTLFSLIPSLCLFLKKYSHFKPKPRALQLLQAKSISWGSSLPGATAKLLKSPYFGKLFGFGELYDRIFLSCEEKDSFKTEV